MRDGAIIKTLCEFLLDCSTGWIRFWERCYIFISNDTTRDKASEACRNYVAKLAMPKVKAMNNFLVDHMTSPMAWLGLSDQEIEGEFKWSDGERLSSFTSWSAGHPLDNGPEFVKIAKDNGSWYNVEWNKRSGYTVSYTHLTLPTKLEV